MQLKQLKLELEPQGVETMPLNELVSLEEGRLGEERVIERAYSSSLYGRRWRDSGVKPSHVRTLVDLRELPFTTGPNIIRTQSGSPIGEFACSQVRLWFSTAGAKGVRKWIPYGDRDLRQVMGLLARIGRVVGVSEKDLILTVADPAPRIGNSFPYLWAMMDMLETKLKLEFIVGSMFMLGRNNWPEFALRKQPTILLARAGDALTLVDHFAEAGGLPGAKPKELLKGLRAGIFFGGPLAPVRGAIVEAYGLEPFDCYISAEFLGLSIECSAHDGVHVWMDICIPEIIPREELDKEGADPRYQPNAVFLSEAEPELEGEYVVTTFADALPLVRYRTGDLVRVVSTEPCRCEVTHPRIAILGRI